MVVQLDSHTVELGTSGMIEMSLEVNLNPVPRAQNGIISQPDPKTGACATLGAGEAVVVVAKSALLRPVSACIGVQR